MKKLLTIIVILLFLAPTALAAPLDDVESAAPDSAREVLRDADASDMDSVLERLGQFIRDKSGEVFSQAVRTGASVLLVPVICSLAGAVYDDKLPDTVNTVGVLAVGALCLGGSGAYIELGRQTLDELDAFAKVLLPTLAAVTGAGGAVTSAAAKYAAASMFTEILMHIGNSLILPLICAYIAASIGDAAFGGGLSSAVKLTKWAVTTALTLLVLAFTLYISVTGIITGSADQAAIKVTKTAISMAVPVVGGMISDAAGAAANGTVLLKNTVGVTGMAVILAVCVVPFLRLGARHLVFKAVAALSQPIGGEKLAKLIEAMGTAMGMLLGLCGAMAVMLYITIISMMKAVVQ